MKTKFDAAIRFKLEARRGDWAEISRCSGVSHSWLSKFVNHHIPNPGLRTLEKLEAVLSEAESDTTQEVTHG